MAARTRSAWFAMNDGLTIAILATTPGYRLINMGSRSLFSLPNGKTVIQHQIDTIRKVYPSSEIIVTLGFQAYKILKRLPTGVKSVQDDNYQQYNASRSIGLALRVASHHNVLIISGDLLFNEEAIRGFSDCAGGSFVVIDTNNSISYNKVGVNINKELVTSFAYAINPKFAQIAFLAGAELEMSRKIFIEHKNSKMLLHEVLNRVINRGGQFYIKDDERSRVIEINEMDDIKRFYLSG